MGWLFTRGASRNDIIQKLIRPEGGQVCLAYSLRGNVMWSVWEIEDKQFKYIRCDLLQRDPGFGWGYKPLSESSYPYYFSCPLRYLDMAPVQCAEWREKVRYYHELRKFQPEIGRVIRYSADRLFQVSRLKPLCGFDENGKEWRLRRKDIEEPRCFGSWEEARRAA